MVLGSLVSSTARRGARPWPSTHASRDSLHPFADHRLAEGKGLSIIGQRQEAKLFDLAAEITYDKMTDAQDSSGTQTRDELSPLRHGVSVQNGSLCEIWGTPAHLQKDYVEPAYFPEERNRALLGVALYAFAGAIGWAYSPRVALVI